MNVGIVIMAFILLSGVLTIKVIFDYFTKKDLKIKYGIALKDLDNSKSHADLIQKQLNDKTTLLDQAEEMIVQLQREREVPIKRTYQPSKKKMEAVEQPQVAEMNLAGDNAEVAMEMKANSLICPGCSNTYWKAKGLVTFQQGMISQEFECGICHKTITLRERQ